MKERSTLIFLFLILDKTSSTELIGVSPWSPMVMCEIGTQGNDDTFTGFDVELFRLLAIELNLEDYEFACMDWDSMIKGIMNEELYCAIAGITITSERMLEGMKFSLPTFVTAIRMLTYISEESNIWSFAEGFQPLLWLYILLTTVGVGIVIWFFEENDWRRNLKDHIKNLEEMIWQAFCSLFLNTEIRLQTMAGRIVLLGYWFMVLVLVTIYTGDLISRLSMKSENTDFNSLGEFYHRGLTAGVTEFYGLSKKYNFKLKEYPTSMKDNNYHIPIIVSELKKKNINGFIHDGPHIQYIYNSYCGLTVFSEDLQKLNYGIAFPPNFSEDIISELNAIIVKSRENRDVKILKQKYISNANMTCADDQTELKFHSFAGLWIILGGSFGFALILHFIEYKFCRNDSKSYTEVGCPEKELRIKDWKCPYIMVGDFIENPTSEIIPIIEKTSRKVLNKLKRNVFQEIKRIKNMVYLSLKTIELRTQEASHLTNPNIPHDTNTPIQRNNSNENDGFPFLEEYDEDPKDLPSATLIEVETIQKLKHS